MTGCSREETRYCRQCDVPALRVGNTLTNPFLALRIAAIVSRIIPHRASRHTAGGRDTTGNAREHMHCRDRIRNPHN